MKTNGERLACRQLVMESRAGVPHYKPGQMGAVVEHLVDPSEEVDAWCGTLSYVLANGHVKVIVAVRDEGAWVPVLGTTSGVRVARNWEPCEHDALTDVGIAALDKAKAEVEHGEG